MIRDQVLPMEASAQGLTQLSSERHANGYVSRLVCPRMIGILQLLNSPVTREGVCAH